MCQILIAEDEARLASFIEKGLRKKGFMTAIAADGEQVVEIARSQKIDLLLLDLGLPLVDGLTVLQELRRSGEQFPIIVITAQTDEREKKAALQAGANEFITKPFRFNDLLQVVQSFLDQS
ncbi:response regulator transcription factor [Leptolyngbya sp. AN03gr2]|uniref:response regulator transcription factor n=1 Tax=unclassified Leptolyngbya TaxID=2650499 RepID=UPI003D32195B